MDGDGRVGASAAAAPTALCADGASPSRAARAAVPERDRAAGWPAAGASCIPVLAGAPSAVGRAGGGGLAGPGLDRRRARRGRRDPGRARLQLSPASRRPAAIRTGRPGRLCWRARASPAAPDWRRRGCATARRPSPACDRLTDASLLRAGPALRSWIRGQSLLAAAEKPQGVFSGKEVIAEELFHSPAAGTRYSSVSRRPQRRAKNARWASMAPS